MLIHGICIIKYTTILAECQLTTRWLHGIPVFYESSVSNADSTSREMTGYTNPEDD